MLAINITCGEGFSLEGEVIHKCKLRIYFNECILKGKLAHHFSGNIVYVILSDYRVRGTDSRSYREMLSKIHFKYNISISDLF